MKFVTIVCLGIIASFECGSAFADTPSTIGPGTAPMLAAPAASATVNSPISPEISAVLMSPAFAEAIETITQNAAAQGATVQLCWFSVTPASSNQPGQPSVEIGIKRLITTNGAPTSTSFGEIAARLQTSAAGTLSVKSLQIYGPASSPGGASVGNF